MSQKTPRKHKARGATPGSKDPGNSRGNSSSSVSGDADGSRDMLLSPACFTSPHFSPVAVKCVQSVHRGGQLTGLPRKVKDSCADWHNYSLDWDNLNTQGSSIISDISNIKISAGGEVESEIGSSPDLKSVLPPGLEKLCDKLRLVYEKMEKLESKMARITTSLKGVAALDDSMHNNSFIDHQGAASPGTSNADMEIERELLFQTWPTHRFYDISQLLLDMFQAELNTKRKVLENVAHSKNREILMMYSAVWLHQPYIEDNMESLLESMLLETGLK